MSIADCVVAGALPWAGKASPDPDAARFLAPHDTLAHALEIEAEETCEIFAYRVLVEAIGPDRASELAPESLLPYAEHPGAIAKWLPELGARLGVLDTHPTEPPAPGDVVLMAHPSVHASVITVDGEAVDGGQERRSIKLRKRTYRVEAGRLEVQDTDLGSTSWWPVLWVIRTSTL